MTLQQALFNTPLIELRDMPNGGSDKSLKKNIQSIDSGLKQVLALRPVSWHWKSPKPGKNTEHGFVAQEVEKVLPDLVYLDSWEDGTERKFLSTKEMVPYLVAAIQEQQQQIESLRKELSSKTKQSK
ncbi:MAG TPA: tail fiber domain-containing protein [Candidatus Saccharimonadales bacterium]|nr:tail fiber domain-containing protein [Candidatus Saccharimonadales bacterium]